MPLKPPAPHFQALARRRARGESPRPRRKQAFDGQALFMQSQRGLAAENAKDARLMPRSRPASGL